MGGKSTVSRLCPWEWSKRKKEEGTSRYSLWGVSRSSHRLGVPNVGSYTEEILGYRVPRELLGQMKGLEKSSCHLPSVFRP